MSLRLAGRLAIVSLLSGTHTARAWETLIEGRVSGDDQAAAVALDSSGDAFAAGWTTNPHPPGAVSQDFTVVKLAGSDGRELWRVVIDGKAGGNDEAQHLVVDSAGDAIVGGVIRDQKEGGAPWSVLKLAGANGDIVWRQALPAFGLNAIALSENEDVVVGGRDEADVPTMQKVSVLRLSGIDGSEIWRSGIGSGGGAAVSLSADPSSGDVVAGGSFCASPLCPLDEQGQPQSEDFGVVKVAAADGAVRWRMTLPGGGVVQSIAVDSVGAVCAAGTTYLATGPSEFTVARLAGEDGAKIWRRDIGGGIGGSLASALSITDGGDAVAAGVVREGQEQQDDPVATLLKLNRDSGDDIWRVSAGQGIFRALVLDQSDNAIGVGALSSPEQSGFAVAKASAAGLLLWQNVLGPTSSRAEAVAVDAAGHIVAGGTTVGNESSFFRVVKLSRDGADYQCVNGMVEPGDECDDGNFVNGDGCDNNCTVSRCGNGVVGGLEQCDDGNLIDGDGCDSNCTPTGCGNGIVTAGEECDDGNSINGDGCDNNCTFTACGNGIVDPGEQCDDGNLVNGDGCQSDCTFPPTSTPTATATGIPTSTPTVTPTHTPTATATVPPTSTTTATRTRTMTPTITATRTPTPCGGDCNHSGGVTVDELIKGINIALGGLPLSTCSAFDLNHDGSVTIQELIAAVSNALYGCGYTPPTPLPTNTASLTATATPTPSATASATPVDTSTPADTATPTRTAKPTQTLRKTATRTATRTPSPLPGCPYRFNQNIPANVACAFSGSVNDICGPPDVPGVFVTTVTNGTRFVAPAIRTPAGFTIVFIATVDSPTSATLVGWGTDPNTLNPLTGTVTLSENGARLLISPTTGPFTVSGCLFTRYDGRFTQIVHSTRNSDTSVSARFLEIPNQTSLLREAMSRAISAARTIR